MPECESLIDMRLGDLTVGETGSGNGGMVLVHKRRPDFPQRVRSRFRPPGLRVALCYPTAWNGLQVRGVADS